ncbi:hypothetical protein THAOC_35605, partial [Thalassiosira oceanica]
RLSGTHIHTSRPAGRLAGTSGPGFLELTRNARNGTSPREGGRMSGPKAKDLANNPLLRDRIASAILSDLPILKGGLRLLKCYFGGKEGIAGSSAAARKPDGHDGRGHGDVDVNHGEAHAPAYRPGTNDARERTVARGVKWRTDGCGGRRGRRRGSSSSSSNSKNIQKSNVLSRARRNTESSRALSAGSSIAPDDDRRVDGGGERDGEARPHTERRPLSLRRVAAEAVRRRADARHRERQPRGLQCGIGETFDFPRLCDPRKHDPSTLETHPSSARDTTPNRQRPPPGARHRPRRVVRRRTAHVPGVSPGARGAAQRTADAAALHRLGGGELGGRLVRHLEGPVDTARAGLIRAPGLGREEQPLAHSPRDRRAARRSGGGPDPVSGRAPGGGGEGEGRGGPLSLPRRGMGRGGLPRIPAQPEADVAPRPAGAGAPRAPRHAGWRGAARRPADGRGYPRADEEHGEVGLFLFSCQEFAGIHPGVNPAADTGECTNLYQSSNYFDDVVS